MKKSIIIYYSVVIATFLLAALWNYFKSDNVSGIAMSGVELMTSIFLFVCGLCSVRSDLLLGLQNGVSRKTTLLGCFISSSIIAFIMAAVETILYTIFSKTSYVYPMFIQLYKDLNCSIVISLLITFAWYAFLYLCSTLFGYVIAALYYRMNKSLKLIVSVGVPGFFIIVLPILDTCVTNHGIYNFFKRLFTLMLGINANSIQPWNWIISCFILSSIFALFSYLLIRRADIKNK